MKEESNYLNLDINAILQCEYEGIIYYEEWRDLTEFIGRYQVSSFGRIKSLKREYLKSDVIRKQRLDRYGYCKIILTKNSRLYTKSTHQLVAIEFLNHTPNKGVINVVDHKNSIRVDNFFKNLQLITQLENFRKRTRKNK